MGSAGTLFGGFILGIIGFLIAVFITRAMFSIGKIVGLLEVIAQELRARNLVEGVYSKIDLSRENVKRLNHLHADAYTEPAAINKPL